MAGVPGNPHFAHLGDHPGIGWIAGSFLAPFDEDPPDDEVPNAAADEAAAARIQAKVTAMRAALSWGLAALEDLNSEDGALVAAERMLRHESDTESESSAPSSVATQIFNPDTSSDEDMPEHA